MRLIGIGLKFYHFGIIDKVNQENDYINVEKSPHFNSNTIDCDQ